MKKYKTIKVKITWESMVKLDIQMGTSCEPLCCVLNVDED